jgi:hypothetical protein
MCKLVRKTLEIQVKFVVQNFNFSILSLNLYGWHLYGSKFQFFFFKLPNYAKLPSNPLKSVEKSWINCDFFYLTPQNNRSKFHTRTVFLGKFTLKKTTKPFLGHANCFLRPKKQNLHNLFDGGHPKDSLFQNLSDAACSPKISRSQNFRFCLMI